MEKKALGRGLNALIPPREVDAATMLAPEEVSGDNILSLPVREIKANKYQPRLEFGRAKLEELINSIKTKGIVQPVLVRKTHEGYELIAGERRLRAARALGLERIPAILKEADDLSTLELSLIENIQREDLNPIEEANAYQRLLAEFGFTQEKVSAVLGKERSTVANVLRLLSLPKKVRDYIVASSITAGHGKALLGLASEEEQLRVCNLVVKKGLSVRETEALVAKRLGPRRERKTPSSDANLASLEEELRRIFGTRVRIVHGKKRGKVEIDYYSTEDLDRIVGIARGARGAA